MEQEILRIVKERLPAIQAQAIADYVAEAEKTKRERDHLEENRIVQEKAHNKMEEEIKSLRSELEKVKDIEKREQAVKDSELQGAVDAQKLKGAEEKVELVKEMFKIVFANTRIKREIFGSTPITNGQYGIAEGGFGKSETRIEE